MKYDFNIKEPIYLTCAMTDFVVQVINYFKINAKFKVEYSETNYPTKTYIHHKYRLFDYNDNLVLMFYFIVDHEPLSKNTTNLRILNDHDEETLYKQDKMELIHISMGLSYHSPEEVIEELLKYETLKSVIRRNKIEYIKTNILA